MPATNTCYVQSNGIRIAYHDFGDKNHPAILLVMGLGTQMIAWPLVFCELLVAAGFRVIRFDNRDIGLSDKVDVEPPNFLKSVVFNKLNVRFEVPYTLNDMAQDTVGLLDALNIQTAHIVGVSMGGMISQIIAANYPERIKSLTSIMSTSGARSLPAPGLKVTRHMLRKPAGDDELSILRHGLSTWALIGSPDYRPSEQALSDKIINAYRRSYYPPGYVRQAAAILASGDRVELLKSLDLPVLVMHGKADVLVPVECGIDTARHIKDAKLVLFDGMGHDLPEPLLPKFVALIVELAAKGENR